MLVDQEDKESIIMGDTNCNLLSQTFDHKAEHLKFITETYQYIQLIDQPTRITSSTRTLIDHIFTNKPNIITNHGVLHVGILGKPGLLSLMIALRSIVVI